MHRMCGRDTGLADVPVGDGMLVAGARWGQKHRPSVAAYQRAHGGSSDPMYPVEPCCSMEPSIEPRFLAR